jgi:hypothetical protein
MEEIPSSYAHMQQIVDEKLGGKWPERKDAWFKVHTAVFCISDVAAASVEGWVASHGKELRTMQLQHSVLWLDFVGAPHEKCEGSTCYFKISGAHASHLNDAVRALGKLTIGAGNDDAKASSRKASSRKASSRKATKSVKKIVTKVSPKTSVTFEVMLPANTSPELLMRIGNPFWWQHVMGLMGSSVFVKVNDRRVVFTMVANSDVRRPKQMALAIIGAQTSSDLFENKIVVTAKAINDAAVYNRIAEVFRKDLSAALKTVQSNVRGVSSAELSKNAIIFTFDKPIADRAVARHTLFDSLRKMVVTSARG